MTRRLRLLGFDDELATAERYALQIAREKSGQRRAIEPDEGGVVNDVDLLHRL